MDYRSLLKPDVIEVGPAVRLYKASTAAVAFGVGTDAFVAFAERLGVPFVTIDADRFFCLFALETALFAALRPWKGRSFALGDEIELPPRDADDRLEYEMKLATLRYSGAAWKELESRVVEAAKVFRKRMKKGKRPFDRVDKSDGRE